MNLFSKINPFYFFLAFAIGLFFVYINDPPKKVIIRHPNPNNAGKTIYNDDDKGCYKYISKEIECPSDKSLIMDHPLEISP